MTSSSSNSITIPSAPQRITLQHGQPLPEMSSFSQQHAQNVSSYHSSFWWPKLNIFFRKRTSGDKSSEPHLEPEVFHALRWLSLVNMCRNDRNQLGHLSAYRGLLNSIAQVNLCQTIRIYPSRYQNLSFCSVDIRSKCSKFGTAYKQQ